MRGRLLGSGSDAIATCRDGDDVGAAGLRNSAKDVERQRYNHGLMTPARVHWSIYAAGPGLD